LNRTDSRRTDSEGVLYVAFGESYRGEARQSILSLREVAPHIPTAVVTDREWLEHPQPDHFLLRPAIHSFECKPRYLTQSPFARTLYIDTDTYIARDVTPIFGLLNHYDVGVRFGGPQLNEGDGLVFHSQCNSGVVLYKMNERTLRMFALWLEAFANARSRFSSANAIVDPRGLNDQRYLSIAIAKSDVRPVHLGEYLNFALFETLVTYSPLAIIHGRLPAIDQVAREINNRWKATTDWHVRLWLPNIRGLLPSGIRRSDPILALALCLRRLVTDIRRLIRRPTC
jgi:hypothetical protein